MLVSGEQFVIKAGTSQMQELCVGCWVIPMPWQPPNMKKALVVYGLAMSIVKVAMIQYSDASTLDGETLVTALIQTTLESSVIID